MEHSELSWSTDHDGDGAGGGQLGGRKGFASTRGERPAPGDTECMGLCQARSHEMVSSKSRRTQSKVSF